MLEKLRILRRKRWKSSYEGKVNKFSCCAKSDKYPSMSGIEVEENLTSDNRTKKLNSYNNESMSQAQITKKN